MAKPRRTKHQREKLEGALLEIEQSATIRLLVSGGHAAVAIPPTAHAGTVGTPQFKRSWGRHISAKSAFADQCATQRCRAAVEAGDPWEIAEAFFNLGVAWWELRRGDDARSGERSRRGSAIGARRGPAAKLARLGGRDDALRFLGRQILKVRPGKVGLSNLEKNVRIDYQKNPNLRAQFNRLPGKRQLERILAPLLTE